MRDIRGAAYAARMTRFSAFCDLPRLLGHPPMARPRPPIDLGAEKDQKIAHRGRCAETRRQITRKHHKPVHDPLNQRKPFDFYRQDKHDAYFKIRIEIGERQKERAVEEAVARRRFGSQERGGHRGDIAHQQIEIVIEHAPSRFQCRADEIEQVPEEQHEDQRDWRRTSQESRCPPPLAF